MKLPRLFAQGILNQIYLSKLDLQKENNFLFLEGYLHFVLRIQILYFYFITSLRSRLFFVVCQLKYRLIDSLKFGVNWGGNLDFSNKWIKIINHFNSCGLTFFLLVFIIVVNSITSVIKKSFF